MSCHGAEGKGNGPIAQGLGSGPPPGDLTRANWKHGDRPEEVWNVVARGVPGTAMAGWRDALGEEGLRAVTAYVYYLAHRPVPEGRARIDPQPRLRSVGVDDGVGLDLDEGGGVDQLGDLDQRCGRTDRAEDLAVDLAGVFPLGNVGQIDPRADHIGDLAPQGLNGRGHDRQARRVWA